MDLLKLPLDLTLEQSFNMTVYQSQVQELSPESAKEMLLELIRQSFIKDNVIKHLIKEHLGT